MKLTNATPFEAGWTVGFMPDGREAVVVAVKATYRLRVEPGAGPSLAERQETLREADAFGEDPAAEAPRYENDFALFKPRCDVLVTALAHAPRGQPARRVDVGVRVGSLSKTFSVVGPRVWVDGWMGPQPSAPLEFVVQPISYETAFGGETYLRNPVGVGFGGSRKNLDGLRMPLTEQPGVPIRDARGDYCPMALGPIGRAWAPRFLYAGTYDARWQQTRLPFLPEDFDFHYFQAAPPDQTLPYPSGGEPIVLANLCPEGRLESSLPRSKVGVTFLRRKGGAVEAEAHLDTVLIEPDRDRLCVTWRARHVLARDPFELSEMVVERGEDRSPGRSRARATGKAFYPSLADLPPRRMR